MLAPLRLPPLNALFGRIPSQCAICCAWPARSLCEACIRRLAPPLARCWTCAIRVAPGTRQCRDCIAVSPPVDACHAAVAYDWPWPECIAQFKFQGLPGWAGPLATLLRSAPWVEPAIEQADLLVPMPLAPGRLRERGYNQAHELARRLDAGKTDARVLIRARETPAQSGLTRAERLQNLHRAFALEASRAWKIEGRRVVLVDDVMTSGASVHAAAAVLRAGGASHITAVVLARTEPGA
ncbi:MAG: ComF family protein [Gammaproteobacteria bacterium]|nr:ComF family protein [Gammaproteobacteria bacterium]MBU1440062.1 ComF family protein [Gammaproteobacteria bacterium]MBU2289188.1 ComF family protein [Gammaproteobacteria bacterium]